MTTPSLPFQYKDGVVICGKAIVGANKCRELVGRERVFPDLRTNMVFEKKGPVKILIKEPTKKTGAFPLEREYGSAMKRR